MAMYMKECRFLIFVVIVLAYFHLAFTIFPSTDYLLTNFPNKLFSPRDMIDFKAINDDILEKAYAQQSNETEEADLDGSTPPPDQPQTNQQPTANAGSEQTVVEGDTINLDGSESSDPDGDTLSYSWEQTAGDSVTLDGDNTATPSFTAPTVSSSGTRLTFQLTVDDGNGGTDTNSVDIVIEKPEQEVVEVRTLPQDETGPSGGLILNYQWTQQSPSSCQDSSALDRNAESQLLLFISDENTGRSGSMRYVVEVVDSAGNTIRKPGVADGNVETIQFTTEDFVTGACNSASPHRVRVYVQEFDGRTVNSSFELQQVRVVPEFKLQHLSMLIGIFILVFIAALRFNGRTKWLTKT